MPRLNHVVTLDYEPTFRTSKVASMFDVQVTKKLTKKWDVNLPIEEKPWQIGLIVGASGSGKSTIANRLWPKKVHNGFTWSKRSLLDDFPEKCDVKSITEVLSKVGFSSPPQWLLPYSSLSTGQKFRVELARCLLEYEDLFVFDEFTSVVDRQVAQVGAYAFQKAIRKTKRQMVAVTCHYDVEAWLEPDWVFDMSSNTFKWGSLRRPEIKLEICRVKYETWELFKDHHYLSADLARAAVCFAGFLDGRPVVFSSWMPFVGKSRDGKTGKRESRTVCLPEFQGLGLGAVVSNTLASMWTGLGFRVFSSTSHPSMIARRIRSRDWILKNQGRSSRGSNSALSARLAKTRAQGRLISSFEYVGKAMNRDEASRLLSRDSVTA